MGGVIADSEQVWRQQGAGEFLLSFDLDKFNFCTCGLDHFCEVPDDAHHSYSFRA